MTLKDHTFKNATIIDRHTVVAPLNDMDTTITILDGGLPDDTVRVTYRDDKRTPDNNIILGAHIKGRVSPVTVIGMVKEL